MSFGSGFPLVCVMVVVVVVAVVEGLEGVFRIQPLPPNAGTTGPGYARRVPQESIQLRLISLMEFISSLFLSSAPALIGAWFGY